MNAGGMSPHLRVPLMNLVRSSFSRDLSSSMFEFDPSLFVDVPVSTHLMNNLCVLVTLFIFDRIVLEVSVGILGVPH